MDSYTLCRKLIAQLARYRPELLGLPIEAVLRKLSPRKHGPGFSSVLWDGTSYTFSAAQSKVVAVLWRAHRRGTPEVRQELLLEAAGSESDKLASLFRDHPGWGALIVPGLSRGTFRLPV